MNFLFFVLFWKAYLEEGSIQLDLITCHFSDRRLNDNIGCLENMGLLKNT